jgi:hypothetical protein
MLRFVRANTQQRRESLDASHKRPSAAARIVHGIGAATLLTALLGVPAAAQSATPLPTATATSCTTPPLSIDELRSLAEAGLPRVDAAVAAQRAARSATPAASPSVATPPAETAPTAIGEAADPATVAAATATVEQFIACLNSRRLASTAALMTERGAQNFLGISALVLREAVPGLRVLPGTGAEGLFVALFVESTTLGGGLLVPGAERLTLAGIDGVRVLPDGRLVVIAQLAPDDEAPRENVIVLRPEDGAWKVQFGPDDPLPAATPEG